MKKASTVTFEQFKKKLLANAQTQRAYKDLETEYQIACQVIEARIKRGFTQEDLAKKANTGQAVISRLERMTVQPSLSLLERLARALDTKISVTVQ